MTTSRSSKRQRVARASEDSSLAPSILTPHNGDKAVDALTQHGLEEAEKAVVAALMHCSQEDALPVATTGRPRRLSARRTKYELREQEDTRIASAEEQRSSHACAARTTGSGVQDAQVVAAAESLVWLRYTIPSKQGSNKAGPKKAASKKASIPSESDSIWSNLDILATAACDMSEPTQRTTRRRLRSNSKACPALC